MTPRRRTAAAGRERIVPVPGGARPAGQIDPADLALPPTEAIDITSLVAAQLPSRPGTPTSG